jgi:DNA mismatch repair ATPase MutL
MRIKVKKPEVLQNRIHIEQEEKPIVDAIMKVSENVHGGEEITQSVDDQRFAQQRPSKEPTEQEQNETKQEGRETQNKQEKGQKQERQEWQETGEQEQEQTSEKQKLEQEEENEEQTENEEQNEAQGENEQTKGEQNEEGQNEEGKEDEEENETESEEESEEQKQSEQAFKLKKETQRLHLELYKLIEYLSNEEKTLTPEPVSQSQALNIKKLLFRQYERKPLQSYYYFKERTEIILVLDNSGSMKWIEEVLDTFFTVALKRKDIQVFIAPNGTIEEEYDRKTKTFQEIDHEEAMRKIVETRLPVLYLGDFDGADTPVEISWTNKVFWLCTETRYKYFQQHDWVNYKEENFKGFFGRAWSITEMIKVLQEFARHIQQQHFWYDIHENDIEEPEDEE